MTSVNTERATAFSNSHKIAVRGDWIGDTIHVVFHDDSIYYTFTSDGGPTGRTPRALAPGANPALDVAAVPIVWIQGHTPPNGIYYVDFGYPIGTNEATQRSHASCLEILPNPFIEQTEIRYEPSAEVENTAIIRI